MLEQKPYEEIQLTPNDVLKWMRWYETETMLNNHKKFSGYVSVIIQLFEQDLHSSNKCGVLREIIYGEKQEN